MNDRTLNLLNAALLACALLGCAAPGTGPMPAEQTAGEMEQIRSLLARFEEGVRDDNLDLIMSLYSPSLSPEERARERMRIAQAVRSYRYSEYHLSRSAGDLKPPADALQKGHLRVKVKFSKPGSKVGDDAFTFRREKGRWYLVHVGLDRPGKGDYADLPAAEREQIITVIARCNQAILSGDMDALVGVISQNVAPARQADMVEDLNDLFKFHKYQYFSSSFSRTGLAIAFGAKGAIAVPLEYMYVRHDGRRGERKIKFCFTRAEGEWQLVDIRGRDGNFWKSFGRIALPLFIQGAQFGSHFAY
ncbi:MAG: hypothetical protein GXP25_06410 [Planctomycetes bacterium]|nr:hypothetical protein [Planctomycetota bacterium]